MADTSEKKVPEQQHKPGWLSNLLNHHMQRKAKAYAPVGLEFIAKHRHLLIDGEPHTMHLVECKVLPALLDSSLAITFIIKPGTDGISDEQFIAKGLELITTGRADNSIESQKYYGLNFDRTYSEAQLLDCLTGLINPSAWGAQENTSKVRTVEFDMEFKIKHRAPSKSNTTGFGK